MPVAHSVLEKEYSAAFAWLTAGVVTVLSFVAWAANYQWHLWPLSTYQLFPLLGLMAFSIMWTHYVVGAMQAIWPVDASAAKQYFRITGYLVLVLICLHPGLLIYQRFKDGFGLPPHSYETYVAPGLGWVTILGTGSLLVFLAFELHRFFDKQSWWHYVVNASDVAMLAIVYHGLRLGSTVHQGWFRTVWIFYGITLSVALMCKYLGRIRAHV